MREHIPRNRVEASPPLALAVGVVQALPDDEAGGSEGTNNIGHRGTGGVAIFAHAVFLGGAMLPRLGELTPHHLGEEWRHGFAPDHVAGA